ncbi:EamA family transporter RarD [Litoribrevibacter albus]|uniref:Chloramphenicol resistance permease RarD n=1 Tax=Litoribrevibacter albus TaxID=1473156 RepID=A0AA37W9W2_9GAMM|nr:EamA family transporter RarD [Litoribrevibacter albus]GLQ33628.1 chloramphenicol resistance permease RarD [Litoribrevibacter albus]
MQKSQSNFFHLSLVLMAFFTWGITPLYFKWLGQVPAIELVVHRVIWSSVVLWILLWFSGLWPEFMSIWKNKSLRNRLLLSGILITGNWLVFVYAILTDQTVEASLGYYINPLVSIAMGGLFLGERLTKIQWAAVIMAMAGVLAEIWTVGKLSMIACSLALSFALYGLARKKMTLHPTAALAVETTWMIPFALVAMVYGSINLDFIFFSHAADIALPLMLAGIVTVIPLLLYVSGLPGVSLFAAGFAQYIAPSMVFLLAIYLFGETVPDQRYVTFGLIWLAVIVVTCEGLLKMKRTSRKEKLA